jgi:hypothetical protein
MRAILDGLCCCSVRSAAIHHCTGSFQKNLEIEKQRIGLSMLQIQANHLVEAATTTAPHLPQASQTWL